MKWTYKKENAAQKKKAGEAKKKPLKKARGAVISNAKGP